MARLITDPWPTRQAQLEAEGWIFYETQRYDPTIIRAYTTAFLTGSPANRRKANRPGFLWLRRTTTNPADPWEGTLSLGVSTLNPWVAGAAMPPDDADWAQGPGAHYLADWSTNPVVAQELLAAEGSPVATLTRTYGDCTDPDVALAAIRDLFSGITVPA